MKLNSIVFAALIAFAPLASFAEELSAFEESAPNPQEPEAMDAGLEDTGATTEKPATAPAAAAEIPPAIIPATEEGDVEEEEESEKWREKKVAQLQGLNKVTARTSEIRSAVKDKTKFGNLDIIVEKCLRGPEDEKTENTALITIWDEIPGQERKQVFRGWMFSSSPAISALEHPIYDVILLSCTNAEKSKDDAKKDDTKKAGDNKDVKKDSKEPVKAETKKPAAPAAPVKETKQN